MKKIICTFVIILVFTVFLCGCSNTLQAETVNMPNPDRFSVVLDENPSAGYTWSYTVQPENLIELISDTYIEPDAELVGSPGKHEWVFSAVADGDVTITFEYARSSSEDTSADTTMIYTYTIADRVPVLVDITEGVGTVPAESAE